MTEGKFSFPVVHGIRADTSNRQILSQFSHLVPEMPAGLMSIVDVLQKRPTTPTLKKYTIAYLRDQTKSFEYTLSVMGTIEKQINQEIARLGGNAGLERIMKALHVDQ